MGDCPRMQASVHEGSRPDNTLVIIGMQVQSQAEHRAEAAHVSRANSRAITHLPATPPRALLPLQGAVGNAVREDLV